jgi:hypothetical protein
MLVFRRTELAYSGISDERMSHKLVFQRRECPVPYTCNSEDRIFHILGISDGISHILVFQRTEYPKYCFLTEYHTYLYFIGDNIPYTCNSENRMYHILGISDGISHVLVFQRTEYPIHCGFLTEYSIYL